MSQSGSVTRVRRTYNQWVANETLEDFALRFTARRARRWSAGRVANTALGSISFLALEAIGGALTLSYGYQNAVTAILIVGAILMLTGFPISYHAAKSGIDIDLLTRGAGFGYLGSTVTSLIYASFTFIFFALEAAILSQALELWLGLPLEIGYLVNALIVIPLVTHGFTRIGVFQKWSQPFWVGLHILPFAWLLHQGVDLAPWTGHTGRQGDPAGLADIVLVAAAAGVAFSLIAQIGEQVDFLRFLPEPRTTREKIGWWAALIAAGPGWAALGTLKMLAGSFLATLILAAGVPPEEAVEPTKMYLAVFEGFLSYDVAILLTGLFVLLSQLKINVTNAYAGSIAWSNFFSRLTHHHPGRVVWLVFNVAIALMLMEFGVFGALENTLALYSHVAVAWIGALTADLVVNKPLRLSPPGIEFRRGYLYDINPVGTGAMLAATVASLACYLGLLGPVAQAFSSFVALGTAFVAAPAIAIATGGRYYLARQPEPVEATGETACIICEHRFDPEDMIQCPFHTGAICSLCCSLEARCRDICKPEGRFERQVESFTERYLPARIGALVQSRYGIFAGVAGSFMLVVGLMLLMIYQQSVAETDAHAEALGRTLALIFGMMVLVVGVAAWLHTLTHESGVLATAERERQTSRLLAEIRAHRRTDAELQRAKEVAEAANEAKSRYLVGISHELRTPLNAILGYAQLLEADPSMPEHRRPGVRIIRRSSEHLADLIEGLLDISKIEAGRLDVYRHETGLRELIDQLVGIFAMEAAEKRLRFKVDIAPELPDRVFADERRVRQILMNLLSNAVRYTSEGEVRFDIAFRNDIATFTVSDTGRGIPAEAQARIFEPFARIEDPAAPVRGTGLGLTITKLLTEMLGGDIRLESAPGEGSRFQVRLMLPRATCARQTEPARRIYGYRGPARRILVVDDNAEHRRLIEDALRPLGFELAMAESGEAALAMVDAAAPDLVLIDVAMPGMSGWTLSAVLRGERGLTAPIVMVSAHAEDQRLSDGVVAYHDDFLAKPVSIDELLNRLERHLRLKWLTDAPERPKAVLPRAAADVLDRLEEMIAIGHVRGAEGIIDEIDTADPGAAAFVTGARRLLEAVDLPGLRAFVTEVRRAV